MNWLTDLLKHLAISRTLTGAIFVTSVAMYVGPRLRPTYFDPVPKEWAPVLVGALVFSGSLLLFWAVAAAWKLVAASAGKASAAFASSTLTKQECEMLLALGAKPTTTLNLNSINYEQASFSHLEIIELMQGLSKRGLVRLNEYDEALVTLTPSGRTRALELLRTVKP